MPFHLMISFVSVFAWWSTLTTSVQYAFGVVLLLEGPTRRASVLINLVILLTYPTNFFIYCTMSTQFRTTFRGMFTACRRTDAAVAAAGPGNGRAQAMQMIQLNTMTVSQLWITNNRPWNCLCAKTSHDVRSTRIGLQVQQKMVAARQNNNPKITFHQNGIFSERDFNPAISLTITWFCP